MAVILKSSFFSWRERLSGQGKKQMAREIDIWRRKSLGKNETEMRNGDLKVNQQEMKGWRDQNWGGDGRGVFQPCHVAACQQSQWHYKLAGLWLRVGCYSCRRLTDHRCRQQQSPLCCTAKNKNTGSEMWIRHGANIHRDRKQIQEALILVYVKG